MKNKHYTFITLAEGFVPTPCNSFKDAFVQMYNWINESFKNGGLAYQVLETAIWIELPDRKLPLMFMRPGNVPLMRYFS